MATPLTWRNINAQSQGDANRLFRAGSETLRNSIAGLANIAGQIQQKRESDLKKANTENTGKLLNEISQMNSTQLAEAKASGAFNPSVLIDGVGSQENVAKILGALDKQDNVIFDRGREDTLRQIQTTKDKNFFEDQEDRQADRSEAKYQRGQVQQQRVGQQNIDNILNNRELDTSRKIDQIRSQQSLGNINRLQADKAVNDLRTSDDITKQLSPNQLRDLQAEASVQTQTLQSGIDRIQNELATTETALGTNKPPAQGSEEYAKQLNSLNSYIDKARQGDRWNPLAADLDEVKQEVANTAKELNASPAQAQAAFGIVIDGDGDYSSENFRKQLQELINDPQSDKLRLRRDELRLQLEQAKIAQPRANLNVRKTLEQQFLEKFNIN